MVDHFPPRRKRRYRTPHSKTLPRLTRAFSKQPHHHLCSLGSEMQTFFSASLRRCWCDDVQADLCGSARKGQGAGIFACRLQRQPARTADRNVCIILSGAGSGGRNPMSLRCRHFTLKQKLGGPHHAEPPSLRNVDWDLSRCLPTPVKASPHSELPERHCCWPWRPQLRAHQG